MRHLVIFGLLFGQLLALNNNLHSTPYLTESFNSFCVPVKNLNGNAFIKLHVEDFVTPQKESTKPLRLPTLVIHLTDIFNFTNIPLMEDFNGLSKDKKSRLIEEDKFMLIPKKDYNQQELLNSYLSLEDDDHGVLTFNVEKSGFYCVYIVPPPELSELKVPLIYHNSYGLLNYFEYVIYSQSAYWIIILALITFVLFRNLFAGIGKNFENLNNISVISKVSVFYVLFPTLGFLLVLTINDFILNSYEVKPWFFVFTRIVIDDLIILISNVYGYMILLFCMGYGVLYYHRKTKSFQQLPRANFRYANILLALNLGISSLVIINGIFVNSSSAVIIGPETFDARPSSTGESIDSFLRLFQGLIKFVVYVSSIRFGFKTMKVIREYPPYSSSVENYVEKNQNLAKAFKRSLYIIFLVPIYAVLAVSALIMYSTIQDFSKDYSTHPEVTQDEISYIAQDLVINHGKYLYYQMWDMYLISIFIIISLYYLWVRGNQGLVIDLEEQSGYTDYFDDPVETPSSTQTLPV